MTDGNSRIIARLIAKSPNTSVPEYIIDRHASVGFFTHESGPVDIDLEGLLGCETISAQHAEIYIKDGTWMIRDQSENGTFIKRKGLDHFGPRIVSPTVISFGDMISFAKIIMLFDGPRPL
jgi:hypothetical protein